MCVEINLLNYSYLIYESMIKYCKFLRKLLQLHADLTSIILSYRGENANLLLFSFKA